MIQASGSRQTLTPQTIHPNALPVSGLAIKNKLQSKTKIEMETKNPTTHQFKTFVIVYVILLPLQMIRLTY
jgi:hypothetical protein